MINAVKERNFKRDGIKPSSSLSLSLSFLSRTARRRLQRVPPPTGSRPSRPGNLLRDEARSRNPAKIPHRKILHEIPRKRLRANREKASLVTKEAATRSGAIRTARG